MSAPFSPGKACSQARGLLEGGLYRGRGLFNIFKAQCNVLVSCSLRSRCWSKTGEHARGAHEGRTRGRKHARREKLKDRLLERRTKVVFPLTDILFPQSEKLFPQGALGQWEFYVLSEHVKNDFCTPFGQALFHFHFHYLNQSKAQRETFLFSPNAESIFTIYDFFAGENRDVAAC